MTRLTMLSVIWALLFLSLSSGGVAAQQGAAQNSALSGDPRPVNPRAILDFIGEIKKREKPLTSISSNQWSELAQVLQRGRSFVGTIDDIRFFRLHDDQQVIRTLVDMVMVEERSVRVNATLLLASVTDNTTVCVVLAALLRSPPISESAQFNLLGVVSVVSQFAWKDTKLWIGETAKEIEARIGDKKDLDKTRELIVQIKKNLEEIPAHIAASSLKLEYPNYYSQCTAFEAIGKLPRS